MGDLVPVRTHRSMQLPQGTTLGDLGQADRHADIGGSKG